MSDKAITTRLQRVEQLRQLCLSLKKAQPVKRASSEIRVAAAADRREQTVAGGETPRAKN
jgi:hypothetical protein